MLNSDGNFSTVFDSSSMSAFSFSQFSMGNFQNSSSENLTDLTFTVSIDDLDAAKKVSKSIVKNIGAKELDATDDVGSVSVVGTGMTSSPGYAATMFEALYDEKVNIEIISTSEIRITCVVKQSNVQRAVEALHEAFKLDVE